MSKQSPKRSPTKAAKRAAVKAKAQAKQNGKLGPVAQVWAIATKLGAKAERKEVLAACVAAGINPATAATQLYRWSKASAAQRNGKVAAKAQKEEPVTAK